MAKGKLTVSFRDFDGERASASFDGEVVSDVNYTAQNALMDDIVTALEGVSIGVVARDVRTFYEADVSQVSATSEWAQRETCWLLSLYDATANKRFQRTIPCADLSLLDESETDPNKRRSLDLAAGAGLALKTAIEAYMLSPYGNAVTLESCVHVGRNT